MVQQERTRKKKHLMSCDPCRYRRIKCVRDSIEEVCEECSYRKFTCTSEHIKARRPAPQRPPPRDGRRLLTIKSVESSPSPDVSHSSMESKLSFSSLQKQLGKHFFEAYINFPHIQIPTGSWTFYYLKMLENDCNLERMKPDVALVCLCAMAIGSRWAGSESLYDDPLLQSPPPPPSDSHDIQRDTFFKNMADRAFKLGDTMGIYRTPSTHALRAVLLLFDLRNYVSDNTQQPQHKSILGLQFSSVPALLRVFISGIPLSILAEDEDELMADLDLGVMWCISFFLDSDLAVNTGYPLSLTERDIEMAHLELQNMMIPKIREAIQSSEPWIVAEYALRGICMNMAFINRFVAQNITAAQLEKQPDNVTTDMVTRFIRWLDDILDVLDLFFERSKQFFRSRSIIPFHWVYTFRFAAMRTAWNVYETIGCYPNIAGVDGSGNQPQTSSMRPQKIERQLGIRVVSLVRTFCKMLHMAQGRFPLGINYSLEKIVALFSYYICNENAQHFSDYSHEEKMANLDTLQRAYRLNSWAWPYAAGLSNILQDNRIKQNLVSATVFQHSIGQYTSTDYGKLDLWSISNLAYKNNSDSLTCPSNIAIAGANTNIVKGDDQGMSLFPSGSEMEDELTPSSQQSEQQHLEQPKKLEQQQQVQQARKSHRLHHQQMSQRQQQQQQHQHQQQQQYDLHAPSIKLEYQQHLSSISPDNLGGAYSHMHGAGIGLDSNSTPTSMSVTCSTPPMLHNNMTPITPMVPVLTPTLDGYGNIAASTNAELWKYINEF